MHDTRSYRSQRSPQAQRVRRAAPAVRRPANWRRRIAVVFLLLIVAAGTGAFLLWQRAAAFNDAVRKAEATSQEKMAGFTAGLNLPPGMKMPF